MTSRCIIFDEATSNTDAYSEQQINGLLDTRLKDKTVIVITHKKEVLSKVDQIVVLKEGVVADLGRYDDLVGKSDELNVMLEKSRINIRKSFQSSKSFLLLGQKVLFLAENVKYY